MSRARLVFFILAFCYIEFFGSAAVAAMVSHRVSCTKAGASPITVTIGRSSSSHMCAVTRHSLSGDSSQVYARSKSDWQFCKNKYVELVKKFTAKGYRCGKGQALAARERAPQPEEPSAWTHSLGIEAWAIGGKSTVADSTPNPSNRVLGIPDVESTLDLRGEYKLTSAQDKFVVRPRFTATYDKVTLQNPTESQNLHDTKLDLTDLYAQRVFSDEFQLTAGLFVDGWGPAEFVNPTNPFFHMNLHNKDFYFLQKGEVLVKGVWNPNSTTSIIAMVEPFSNNTAEYRDGETFTAKWVLRAEYQSENSVETYAFLVGQEEDEAKFFGEYVQLRSDSTGLSAYLEARHTSAPMRFDLDGSGALKLTEDTGFQTYSVVGVRAEGTVDARLEWIYYQLGYTEAEWKGLLTTVTTASASQPANLAAFYRPGLDFTARNWLSLSIRKADLGPRGDWQWTNRFLTTTGDSVFHSPKSSIVQSDLEVPAFSAWTFYGSLQFRFGDQDSRLLLDRKFSGFVGARWAY